MLGGIARALVGCALGALTIAPGAAQTFQSSGLSVEFFDAAGISQGSKPLYLSRHALVLTDDPDRPRLLDTFGWLQTTGFNTSAPSVTEDVFGALDEFSKSIGPQDLAVVVLDYPADQTELSAPSDGRNVSIALTDILNELNELPARHVLVVFTDPVDDARLQTLRMSQHPVLETSAWFETRLMISPAPESGESSLQRLSDALRGDIGDLFDPDGYVVVEELPLAYNGLSLKGFGNKPAHGLLVLSVRQSFETPLTSTILQSNRRQAFSKARTDLARKRLGARDLRDLIAIHGTEHRDGQWAEAVIGLLDQRETDRAARLCDRNTDFEPAQHLMLGVSVIGKLDQFDSVQDLGAQWLETLSQSIAESRDISNSVAEACHFAVRNAPGERIVKVASLLGGRSNLSRERLDLLRQLLHVRPDGKEAAVLAGLIEMSLPLDRVELLNGRQLNRLRRALSDAAEAGSAPSKLVLGLLLLRDAANSGEDHREGLGQITAAADQGMPLARAVYAALAVSKDRKIADLRGNVPMSTRRAVRYLDRAGRRGFRVSRNVVDLEKLRSDVLRQDVGECMRVLDFDPTALMDPHIILDDGHLADVLDQMDLRQFFGRTLELARIEAWKEKCAPLLTGRAQLPDNAAMRLALVLIAAGEPGAAGAVLARSASQSALSRVLASALARSRGQTVDQEFLRQVSKRRSESRAVQFFGALLLDPELQSPDSRSIFERLSGDGVPAAQYLKAVDLARSGRSLEVLLSGLWLDRAVASGLNIPSEIAQRMKRSAGKAVLSYLGLVLERLDPDRAEAFGHTSLPRGGVLITSVTPDGPASRAGLREGMILISVNNEPIRIEVPSTQARMLDAIAAGDTLTFTAWTKDQSMTRIDMRLPREVGEVSAKVNQNTKTLPSGSLGLRSGPGGVFPVIDQVTGQGGQILSALEVGEKWVHLRISGRGKPDQHGFAPREVLQ